MPEETLGTPSDEREDNEPTPILELRTARLSLVPLVAADVLPLHALWTSRGVRRYLWDDEAISLDETQAIVEESAGLMHRDGLGLWAIRERGQDALVGFCGYWYFHQPPVLEFLFGVAESHWRLGIGCEAGDAMLDYGFTILRFDEILASTDFENSASIRALERLGFSPCGRATVEGLDTLFYRVVPVGRNA